MISLSIVSHGQGHMVQKLLADIDALVDSDSILEVILTCNIDEPDKFNLKTVPLTVIKNNLPKGFAANHNGAFKQSKGDYFCVLNPDIHLIDDPFKKLLENMQAFNIGLIAPLIMDAKGQIEDSVRKFPSLTKLIKRVVTGKHDVYSFSNTDKLLYPDWVGGMFMLFERKAYQAVKGFDEDYFLYYEDVDICVRLWQKGLPIAVFPEVQVIHQAQRQSHKQLKYLRWHISSMIRFFAKHLGRLPNKKHL